MVWFGYAIVNSSDVAYCDETSEASKFLFTPYEASLFSSNKKFFYINYNNVGERHNPHLILLDVRNIFLRPNKEILANYVIIGSEE